MSLNLVQSREFNRAFRLQNCLLQNAEACEFYLPFNSEVKLFYSNVDELSVVVPTKEKTGVVATEKKGDLKTEVAIDANDICTAVSVYAVANNNKELANDVRYRTTDITHAKDSSVFTIITTINNAVMPLIGTGSFDTYNITAAMLESLVSRAKTFTNDIGKAGVIDKNRGVINRTIDEILAAIRGNVSNMNLLSNQVKKKYPKFVENYFENAAIDYSNIHHSGIKGIIINSNNGAVVEGVTLTLEGIKKIKTAITNIDGAYEIIKFLSGKAKLTITAPGFDSQTVEVDIIRGKIIELNYSIHSQIIEFKTA